MSKIRIKKEILNGHKIVLEDGILSESVGDSKQRIFFKDGLILLICTALIL